MSLYLYGVTSLSEPIDFGAIGFGGEKVRTIPLGNVSALVGPSPQEEFKKAPKEELISLLLAHQRTIETIMKRFFVLPFKFGTMVRDEAELAWVLEEGRELLLKMMDRMKGCTEVDVLATWDVRAILREIAEEEPEIRACKEETAQGQGDKAFIGMLLAQALKRRAGRWKKRIETSLAASSELAAEHDLLNDEMVLNTSFLIKKDREKGFFRGVEEMDRSFEGKLNFKCVGPLPPYSFATVTLKRFDPGEVGEAARVLGLNGRAALEQVKKVYKGLSMDLHPDRNPEASPERFELLNKAYELIADYCKEGVRSLEKGAVERCVRLEAVGRL